jgi:hypothetical protein
MIKSTYHSSGWCLIGAGVAASQRFAPPAGGPRFVPGFLDVFGCCRCGGGGDGLGVSPIGGGLGGGRRTSPNKSPHTDSSSISVGDGDGCDRLGMAQVLR